MTELLQVNHLSKQYPGFTLFHSEHGAARIRNSHYVEKGFLCK